MTSLLTILLPNSCVDGSLAPPTPSPETTFRLSVVSEGSSSPGSFVEASGLVFRVGGEPGTYCPSNVGTCPPGTETDFICVDGYCSLVGCSTYRASLPRSPYVLLTNPYQNVAVPGGQYIYIAINGALSFTQAHSGIAPPGSFFNGFDVNDGKLQFQGDDWLSCPPADGTTDFQLFASALSKGYNGCVSVTLSIEAIVASNFGAWQYI